MKYSRAMGAFGVGAVPISEILAYCELVKIDSIEDRSDLAYIVSEMDSVFMEHFNKKK